jgi:glycosyltransferase involved in cell wall biosynthesis
VQLLFLNHNVVGTGGTFLRAFYLARELARQGHTPTVLAISPERKVGYSKYVTEGVDVVEMCDALWGFARTGWDPWDTLNRCAFVSRRRYDLVHAFDCRPAVILPALLASRRAGCSLVIDWADWWGRGGTTTERSSTLGRIFVAPIETFFEESFRTCADATTVISHPLAARAEHLGVPASSIRVIPQGCDPDVIRPIPMKDARRHLGLAMDDFYVGHLGVLLPRDARLLFDAMSHLTAKESKAALVLIGRHKTDVRGRRNTSVRVLEAGYVADAELPYWLGACDAVVVPLSDTIANRGRWPSKANAYLAAGRPVVATRVGDFAKVIEAHDAGLVVEADGDALATGLLEVLGAGAKRENWSDNARRLAETSLAWSTISTDLLDLYALAQPALSGPYTKRP